MFTFFLKKNFCDIWDNFFLLLISNIVPIVLVVACFYGVTTFGNGSPLVTLLSVIFSAGIIMTVVFAWGANARKIADFNTPNWTLFLKSLKGSFFIGFGFGVFASTLGIFTFHAFRTYMQMFRIEGAVYPLIFAIIIAVFGLVSAMALQWFIPLYFLQEQNGFVKCLKKSYVLFFDNVSFTFKVFLNSIFLIVLSFMTIGFIPGLNGVVLSLTNALRLRLYKYDWMEENGYFENRDEMGGVPWDELLAEDRESLGSRKLGSFLFPWK